jgi:hypothetical protein
MTNRTVFLSGYPTNALTGRIDIDASLMRDSAERCTRNTRLSWADVRALDDSFRREQATGLESNLTYLRHKHIRKHAGLHLCAIASGLRFHMSPQEHLLSPKAASATFHVTSPPSPRLRVSDEKSVRMNFPNPASGLAGGEQSSEDYGLYNLQLESAFGRLCRGFDAHMAANNVAMAASRNIANVGRVIDNYVKKIRADKTLCDEDKNDMVAICVLKAWVSGVSGANPLNTKDNLNYWYNFGPIAPDTVISAKPLKVVRHPIRIKLQKLLAHPCNYEALRFACENLSGFGNDFCVSWTDYANAYPDVR